MSKKYYLSYKNGKYDKYRFKSKEIPKYVKKKENTYCLVCEKKKTNNKNIKGVALENKICKQKSICVNCGSKKSTFLKPVKPNKKQK